MPCETPGPWGSLHLLTPRARRVGLLSTYPPALCGLATFAIALEHELVRGGDQVDVVVVDDGRLDIPEACERLSNCDVAIIQHEYGIYGGRDGDEVLDVLRGTDVPTVVVLHTVPAEPTENQRLVLERVCELASRVVVMTVAAGDRLLAGYDVDETTIRVIPHGATPPTPLPHGHPDRVTDRRPTLLTWGLLGPGKGIEHVIRAMSLLTNLRPAVQYTIAGATHPKVFARDGDVYRQSLVRETWSAGVAASVHFDETYRDVADLMRLVAASTVVVLPYDSRDQVTSGVLVDAIAAGRPVIATAFPHAVELLSGGAGIVVPHANPVAMASAIRSVVSDPDHLAALTAKARLLAPTLTWSAVATGYRDVFDELVPSGAGAGTGAARFVISRTRTFDHLVHLSDQNGLFEHADGTARRLEHGYCTDDNARLLVVSVREHDDGAPGRLGRQALSFCLEAQAPDGRIRNRLDHEGRWTDEPATKDWWGRAVWAFGAAARHHTDPAVRAIALRAFELSGAQRSPWPRSMAFAALGAADVLAVNQSHRVAHRLMVDAVACIGTGAGAATWPWPEPRLAYANAAIPETLIAAGAALSDPRLLDSGLAMLTWLVDQQTRDGHLSVVGVGGRDPGTTGPQFDQQPIEVAAIADACWRAYTLTGESRWANIVLMAAAWFDGDNDSGSTMWDSRSGGGYDGLRADGPNTNEGAESTLTFVSTVQRARAVQMVMA